MTQFTIKSTVSKRGHVESVHIASWVYRFTIASAIILSALPKQHIHMHVHTYIPYILYKHTHTHTHAHAHAHAHAHTRTRNYKHSIHIQL